MYRLFKSQHICRSSDFAKFRSRQAQSVNCGTIVLKVVGHSCGSPRNSFPRFGIITSKKIGNAVARNRIRRIIRENFRLNPKIFRADCDYLFIALRGISDKPNKKIGEEILDAAKKITLDKNFPQNFSRPGKDKLPHQLICLTVPR
ncbi:MAG: ribonuclease P protein component [Puniceicoccales bacterium]|nr:ribonuclease P protein component [Puniceicoccales bacterium]